MSERIFRKICGIDVSVNPDDPNINVEKAFDFAEEAVKHRMECCAVVLHGIKHPNAYIATYDESQHLKNSGRTDYKTVTLKNGITVRIYPEEGLTKDDITETQFLQTKWAMEDAMSVEHNELTDRYYLME